MQMRAGGEPSPGADAGEPSCNPPRLLRAQATHRSSRGSQALRNNHGRSGASTERSSANARKAAGCLTSGMPPTLVLTCKASGGACTRARLDGCGGRNAEAPLTTRVLTTKSPQLAASRMAMQNASVREQFRKIRPRTSTFRTCCAAAVCPACSRRNGRLATGSMQRSVRRRNLNGDHRCTSACTPCACTRARVCATGAPPSHGRLRGAQRGGEACDARASPPEPARPAVLQQ